MKLAYWIIAGLLALFYLYAGGIKLAQTREKLLPTMAWIDNVPMSRVRLIGAIEVLGAIGLILPPLTGIAPALALVAAIGFVILQVLATALHLRRGETDKIGLNIGLIVLAAVAAWLSTAWL